MENLFILATRKQFRFASPAGALGVEDLWALPLTSKTNRANLDDVARVLHADLKETGEVVSFVSATAGSAHKEELEAKFEIVKHIIGVRLAENAAALEKGARAEKRQKILEIIESKKDKALSEASIEDLQRLLTET